MIGALIAVATYAVIDLSPRAEKFPITYLEAAPRDGWDRRYKTERLVLRYIEPGTFTGGGETFTVSRPFWCGIFEVTQRQYELVVGKRFPSRFVGDDKPVDSISHDQIRGGREGNGWPKDNKVDAGTFLGCLRAKTGMVFDLPTEVQWEYVCRANGKGQDINNDARDDYLATIGRFRNNGAFAGEEGKSAIVGTAEVGSYEPNAWGIYDLFGNVWEWTLDRAEGDSGRSDWKWWIGYSWKDEPKERHVDPRGRPDGTARICRGGGWWGRTGTCRTGGRGRFVASKPVSDQGFRVVAPVDGEGLSGGVWFDVRNFGAKGDGVTKDTVAVQRAIDACVAAGGGRVVVTNGTFLIAPIALGSGVELHLARGAGLLGSRDLSDYPNRSGIKHVQTDALPRKRNCSLVFAEECEEVSITGEGFIDANGACFVKPKSGDDWTGWHFERNVDLDKSLPRVVFFTGCRDVRVSDMTLRNPPSGWSFWMHDCDGVLFDCVRVRADVRYPNNDGIHINSCRDVIVRNCDLETGDDSIVVRANNRSLKEDRICERVVVSNCTCRSWSAGIRIAWANDGTIRNCLFSNIRMRDTSVGIALALPGIPEWNKYDYGREATLVEDLVFEDIEMDGIYGRPILMWMSPRPDSHVEAVRRITFRNVRSIGLEKPLFMGLEGKPFEDICFTDCEFRVVGDDRLPDYLRHGAAAWDRYVGSRSCHCNVVTSQ